MPAPRPPPRLKLHLLGGMEATFDGRPLSGKLYGKVLALLAFLAVESNRRHSREQLADLLWSALPAEAARRNLRQALYYLRRTLDDDATFLLTDRDSVRFSPTSPYWLDLEDFTAPAGCPHANQPDSVCPACVDALEQRSALYRGEFLSGLALDEAPEFEQWRDSQRESLHREALALLERLRQHHEQRHSLERALRHARRYTELEPWDEEGHRQLMRLLAENGQRGAALAQYETCRAMLLRDLEVEPEEETRALVERIRNNLLKPSPTANTASPTAAERRQATVLCCNFALPDDGDPEEIAEQLRGPRQQCAAIIIAHGGHIAQTHTGGTLLAYFGYPVAFEDAAIHAVRAGLAINSALEPCVAPRIGIHTGVIVAGANPALLDAAGVTSTLAQRLTDLAPLASVVISDASHRLVQGYFKLQTVEGAAKPIYRVDGPSEAITRLEATQRLSPLTGRRSELAKLQASWNEARQGQSQLVVMRGEAGIGKSRLGRALRDIVITGGGAVRKLYCFPEYRHTPLYPIVALFEAEYRLTSDDPTAARLQKLNDQLAVRFPALQDEAAAVLAPLLSADSNGTPLWSRQQQKQRTITLLLELLDSIATQQPLLLIVEDVHWIDPSSLELLERFAQRRTTAPILALLTARPDFQPAWLTTDSIFELPPLGDDEIIQLVQAADRSLPIEAVQRIVARADGIPLFAEEMAFMAAEATTLPAEVPATLRYLLLARLDALPTARRTAQLAATIGREFDRDLLQQVAMLDAPALDAALLELQNARLIALAAEPSTDLRFRHALIQEAAYHSQTRADRQAAHRRIAQTLSAHFPRRAAQQPEQLARHFTAAGAAAEAASWWLTAGRLALRAYAHTEAVDHLQAGLGLIDQLPSGAERDALELDLLLPLGQALLALRGYGSTEAAAVYDRAFGHCREQPPNPRRFEALWGLWMVSSSRPEATFADSARLAQELLHDAKTCRDAELLTYAFAANANIAVWRGELQAACRHAEAALTAAAPLRRLDRLDGHDPRVASLAHLSWACFHQGRREAALAASARSIALAKELAHPDSICFALIYAGELHRFLHCPASTARFAQEARELADQYQLPLWQGASEMQLGWVAASRGDAHGIDRLIASATAMQDVMPGVLVGFLHALAEAYGFLDQHEAQLQTVEEALRIAASVDEHLHSADLYRLKGECLYHLDHAQQASTALREAQRLARAQGAHGIDQRISAVIAD